MLVHEALNVDTASTRAFVEDGKLRLVIEQSRHLSTEMSCMYYSYVQLLISNEN